MLTFINQGHEYRWQGEKVPHVTGVLSRLKDYSAIPADQLEVARQKGVAVHRMVELHAKGDLDRDTLPEWMRPVLAYWEKFVADTGFEILESESQVFHPMFRYAGTLDLVGRMRGSPDRWLIDVKRSFFGGRAIGLQTAAYKAARDCSHPRWRHIARRGALMLREDKSYRLINDWDDVDVFGKGDFSSFLALLATQKLEGNP